MFRLSSKRSQSAVEFALAAPVIILLLFGLLDLCRAYYFSIQLQDAAREGVRVTSGLYAATGPTDNDICTFLQGDLTNAGPVTCVFVNHKPPFVAGTDYTSPSAGRVVAVIYPPYTTSPCNQANPCRGYTGGSLKVPVAVAIYYSFTAVTPFISAIIPNGLIMSTSAEQVSNW